MKLIPVTPKNVQEETLFCVKDIKSPAFDSKRKWFEKRYGEGLRMKILKDDKNKMLGFIEYVPVEYAWRPIEAQNLMFIHCIMVYSKKDREKGYGSILINEVEKESTMAKMDGICTMTSKGVWIADKTVFEKNGFIPVDHKGRFDLLFKKLKPSAKNPELLDWTENQKKYQGWHLFYADQCPWHQKSVTDLMNTAMDFDIDLKVHEIKTAQEAKNVPSGYGTYSLVHNGKLMSDHYISATRFRNILKKASVR